MLKSLVKKALEKGKITIASENSQVDEGMLLSVGYDYWDMGRKAGLIALEILIYDDKNVSEFANLTMSFEKYVNKEVLKKLNLSDNGRINNFPKTIVSESIKLGLIYSIMVMGWLLATKY